MTVYPIKYNITYMFNKKLILLIMLNLVTSCSSGYFCNKFCPPQIPKPCYIFGDCIDQGHDDNLFWVTQLNTYFKDSLTRFDSLITEITSLLHIPNHTFTIYEGNGPSPFCTNSLHNIITNKIYLRKTYNAYNLAELSKKTCFLGRDIFAQILYELNKILKKLKSL